MLGSPAVLSPVPGNCPYALCPNVRVALELQVPSGTLQLAVFIPTGGSGPGTIRVARVKVWGRASPGQCLLGKNTVRENSRGWSSWAYAWWLYPSLISGEPDDITSAPCTVKYGSDPRKLEETLQLGSEDPASHRSC